MLLLHCQNWISYYELERVNSLTRPQLSTLTNGHAILECTSLVSARILIGPDTKAAWDMQTMLLKEDVITLEDKARHWV